jgi:hypothetical protein
MGKYKSVEDYVKDQDDWKGIIINQLRKILKDSAPNATEKIKWSQPVYEDEIGPFCFIRAHKNHVNIGFWRGAIMKDSEKILEGEGVKMRHIKIFKDSTINIEEISDFINQALHLNQELGDPTK